MRFKNILEKLSNLNLGTISQNCSKLLTLINENEIKNDFFIELQDLFFANFYDLIIIAVPHNLFKKIGIKKIRKFGKSNSKLYDIKRLFNKNTINGKI